MVCMNTVDKLTAVADRPGLLDFGTGSAFQLDMSDIGQVDSLRFTTMSYVVEERYDLAVDALRRYVERRAEYPQYARKTAPLVRHCTDLIYAIRSKRSLPGLGNLSASKQQEIYERAREHFEDLKNALKRMEKIEIDMRRADMRSTLWVLNALTLSVFAIVMVGFVIELADGLLQSIFLVFADGVDSLFRLIGL